MAATLVITVRFDNDDQAGEAALYDCDELAGLFYGISDGQVRAEIVSNKITDFSEPVDLQALIDADEDEDEPRAYGCIDNEEADNFPRVFNPSDGETDALDAGSAEFETCFLPKLGTLEFARPGRPATVGELRAMLRNVPDDFKLEAYSERMDSTVDFTVDCSTDTETITFYTEN